MSVLLSLIAGNAGLKHNYTRARGNINGHHGLHCNAFHIGPMTGYKSASLGEHICKGPGTAAWDGAPVAQNGIRVLARRQRSGSRVLRLITAF